MSEESVRESAVEKGAIAYLVVREGNSWRDVFRLVPGQVTTIGRASTNRIVLHDEVCSRNHCEVFTNTSGWVVRDLESRNGTVVDQRLIKGDHELVSGELIQIGATNLGFTFDLSQPFAEVPVSPESQSDTATDLHMVYPADGEPAIVRRKRMSDFRSPPSDADPEKMGKALAVLYRLALEMGTADDSKQLYELVLKTLLEETGASIGAILCLPVASESPMSEDLRIVAYRSGGDQSYERVSDYLSTVVMKEYEAVLAHDIQAHADLAARESLDEIQATSVICAPLRMERQLLGVVHLYATETNSPLVADDLEFTLAVADQLALVMSTVQNNEKLSRGLASARSQNRNLREQLGMDSQLVGGSEAMQNLRETTNRIAQTEATVLIRGESGVGKELVARAIHFSSLRSDGAFVCMNCAALSESLLESELFGHERGAFTGATNRKIGKFEQAHRGTLFLDEVGEMSEAIQAKFLRVLEGHRFERVGGQKTISCDTRVVAATNRNLEQAVVDGTFRKDLYFRLQVVEIEVPSLRDHASDIAELAEFFLKRLKVKINHGISGFSDEAMQALRDYHWPGNIRELQNTVERTVILCRRALIEREDIRLSSLATPDGEARPAARPSEFQKMTLESLEKQHILATLEMTSWNKSRASQILGIERSTLDRKLKRFGVSRPQN